MESHGGRGWRGRLAGVALALGVLVGVGCASRPPAAPRYGPDGELVGGPWTALSLPRIDAGFGVTAPPHPRVTPVMGVEVWRHDFTSSAVTVDAGAGYQLLWVGGAYSPVRILDCKVGPFIGRDFEEDGWTWGVRGTLSRW